jgi:hypothetical protein
MVTGRIAAATFLASQQYLLISTDFGTSLMRRKSDITGRCSPCYRFLSGREAAEPVKHESGFAVRRGGAIVKNC